MLPTGKEITARAKLTVVEMTNWAREEFNLPNFSFGYKLAGSSDRSWCKYEGRTARLQIGVQSLMTREVVGFMEYKSFNNYMEVGGFKTSDWRQWLDAVFAHEVAHAIQFELINQARTKGAASRGYGRNTIYLIEGLGWSDNGHGTFFLEIYKRIRNRFVNASLTRADYTAPRSNFKLDARIAVITSSCPHAGTRVRFSQGKQFVVLGRDPTIRGLYCYRAKNLATGAMTRLKLKDILSCTVLSVKSQT